MGIASDFNVVDSMTKALEEVLFRTFQKKMSVWKNAMCTL